MELNVNKLLHDSVQQQTLANNDRLQHHSPTSDVTASSTIEHPLGATSPSDVHIVDVNDDDNDSERTSGTPTPSLRATPANGNATPTTNAAANDNPDGTDRSSPASTARAKLHRFSAAYVRNNRLSRYRNALLGVLPFRIGNLQNPNDTLPLDTIGSVSAATFYWLSGYRVHYVKPRRSCRNAAAADSTAAGADALPNDPHRDTEACFGEVSGPKSPLVPQLPESDRCEANAKRLLGLYKYEEQTYGRAAASMYRVVWQFIRTRFLVSVVLHTFANLVSVLMYTALWQPMLWFHWSKDMSSTGALQIAVLTSCFALFYWTQNYLNSWGTAISLRTAVRLRTACLGAVCSKSLKSDISNKIGTYQFASLAADESKHICDMVVRLPTLFANGAGLIIATIAGVVLIGPLAIWPVVSMFGVLLVGGMLALLSSVYQRRSAAMLGKKLAIVEEYHATYKPEGFLNAHDTYVKRFSHALSAQYAFTSKAEFYRPAGYTLRLTTLAVLLTSLHVIWSCLDESDNDSDWLQISMLSMYLLYVLLIPDWLLDSLEAIDSLFGSSIALERVKQSITLAPPDLPKMRPARDVKAYMSDAIFRWDADGADANVAADGPSVPFQLCIDSLTIPCRSVVGITGESLSGKTSLVHALLGHLRLCSGEFYQRDKGSYHPEQPFCNESGTVRDNIVFFDDWNEARYVDCLKIAGLHFNEGVDERTAIGLLADDTEQLQRIEMARAMYSDRDYVILDEPLSVAVDQVDVFAAVLGQLRKQQKTVVLVSQNEALLTMCERIYLLQNGRSAGYAAHADISREPAYRQCVDAYAEQRLLARQKMLAGPQIGAHSQSTEDLVPPASKLPTMTVQFSRTAFLLGAALCMIDALYSQNAPLIVEYRLQISVHRFSYEAVVLLVFLPVFWLTGWLRCTYMTRNERHTTKREERDLFAKYLSTALQEIRADYYVRVVQHLLADNHVRNARAESVIQHCCWLVASALLFVMYALIPRHAEWLFVILFPLYGVYELFAAYAPTVHRYANLENESRLKLLHLLGNQLQGRVSVQSMDVVPRMRAFLYRTIEENAAAELLVRSTLAYTGHAFIFCQGIALLVSLSLVNVFAVNFLHEEHILMISMLLVVQMRLLLMSRFERVQLQDARYLRNSAITMGCRTSYDIDLSTMKYET